MNENKEKKTEICDIAKNKKESPNRLNCFLTRHVNSNCFRPKDSIVGTY